MRISDWSSDVCSSDLLHGIGAAAGDHRHAFGVVGAPQRRRDIAHDLLEGLGHMVEGAVGETDGVFEEPFRVHVRQQGGHGVSLMKREHLSPKCSGKKAGTIVAPTGRTYREHVRVVRPPQASRRSEERRVGTVWDRTFRSGGSAY